MPNAHARSKHRNVDAARFWRAVTLCLLAVAGCKGRPTHADVLAASTTPPESRPSQPAASQAPPPQPTTAQPTTAHSTHDETNPSATRPLLSYELLTLGADATPQARLPWIVAFHGLGDNPRGFAQLFTDLPLRVHVYLVRAPLPYGAGYDWFGERVTGDPERLTLAIQQRLSELSTLLDELARQPQNEGSAIVTGFSQGGVLSFAVAAAGLDNVRAALPIAGWLPPRLAAAGTAVPVYAFHGEADQVVPFAATQRMVSAWQGRERTVEYRTYPGVAHTISWDMRREWVARLVELTR